MDSLLVWYEFPIGHVIWINSTDSISAYKLVSSEQDSISCSHLLNCEMIVHLLLNTLRSQSCQATAGDWEQYRNIAKRGRPGASQINYWLFNFQGFSVSLLYCFLNSEVRLALRHRIERWRDERNIRLGQPNRQSRRYTHPCVFPYLELIGLRSPSPKSSHSNPCL